MENSSPTPQVTLQQQQNSADYLAQLLKDKKQIAAFPNVFVHLERLLDDEINKVRISLFHLNGNKKLEPLQLPDARGPIVTLMEKVFVPVKEFPDFNFVGRILGPRGMTAKQLEQDTGCKIMVRGKGSMRDKKKEEQNRGKANWEHLNEELHVLITVEDTEERAKIKLERAVECISKLLIPAADGEDDLKKSQLMELAIMNGTYRDGAKALQQQQAQRLLGQPGTLALTSPVMRSPTAAGAPLILPPRMPTIPGSTPSAAAAAAAYLSQGMAAPPPLVSPADPATGLMYHPVEYPVLTAAAPTLLEYQTLDPNAAAVVVSSASSPFAVQRYIASAGNLMQYHDPSAIVKQRRHIAGMRDHPYQRGPVSLS